MTEVQEVIATLKDILDRPDFYNDIYYNLGLCEVLNIKHGQFYVKLLRNSFKSYDLHSGDATFPVPHPSKSPTGAYLTGNLWDSSTEYGKNRLALVQHFINFLENKIALGELS